MKPIGFWRLSALWGGRPAPSRRSLLHYATLLVFSVALQLILFKLSAFLAYNTHASFWYAPAGLSVALFLLLGGRAFPIVLCCVAATTLLNDPTLGPGVDPAQSVLRLLGYPLAHALPYWAGVSLLHRATHGVFNPRNPGQIMRFLFVIPIAAGGAAFLGAYLQHLLDGTPYTLMLHMVAVRWIGDMVAALCLSLALVYLHLMLLELIGADLGYRFVYDDDVHPKRLASRDALYVPLALLFFSIGMYLAYTYPEQFGLSLPVYAMVISLLWTIYKARSPVVYVVPAVSTFALAYTASAFGLLAKAPEYQVAMIAVGSIAYFTNAAVSSQRRALALSEQVNRRLLTEIREKESLQTYADDLHLKASRDALTRTLNRAFFEEAFPNLYSRSVRQGTRHCLAFVDLNDFKHVNDRFGHHAGDEALKAIARILMDRSRKGDTVARYGGDEFVVLLPNVATPHQADAIIGQWKQAVAACRVQGYPELRLSISVGRALFPSSSQDETEQSILQAADQEMYQDKMRMKAV
ncbi:sensor domain-containing diguanylate cyclase [Halochromatium glycolicum]|uniref:diguanylate cyclase n=1 Tax=Halochromatium glycolicum TaxID=85075 RepID=A0AAJ0U4X3_9GAMM|nr:diguanylate cyclase [Halochromatium glycolicum]MBK1705339.1 hypothetical protein [Halochromatium glycolicum]